jgi:hypothetical protein
MTTVSIVPGKHRVTRQLLEPFGKTSCSTRQKMKPLLNIITSHSFRDIVRLGNY